MGGGEVARYIGTHGSERVKKAVLISAITPFLPKTADNPGAWRVTILKASRRRS
jgi:non-heme chloroperoxidase